MAGDVRGRPLQVRRLCKEDCLMLETKYCRAEYSAIRRRDHSGLYITADVLIYMKNHGWEYEPGVVGGLGWDGCSPLSRQSVFFGQSLN